MSFLKKLYSCLPLYSIHSPLFVGNRSFDYSCQTKQDKLIRWKTQVLPSTVLTVHATVGNRCEAPFCILITIVITITGLCHAGCSHFIKILLLSKNQFKSFYYGCITTHAHPLMLQTAFFSGNLLQSLQDVLRSRKILSMKGSDSS